MTPTAVERLPRTACRGCAANVLHVEDVDTGEAIVVDPDPIDGGHITVWAVKGHSFARRYGQPARLQPAWNDHDCPTPNLTVPQVRPPDPYEDKSPAAQQHGGWRE